MFTNLYLISKYFDNLINIGYKNLNIKFSNKKEELSRLIIKQILIIKNVKIKILVVCLNTKQI